MRPSTGTLTGRVWEIADELARRGHGAVRRADVIAAFVAEGGNPNTANTQFQMWKQAQRRRTRGPQRYALQVREAGRIVIPNELRAKMGIEEGDQLLAELVGRELHLVPRSVRIQRAQALVRSAIPKGANLVDELIAERRAEADRDSAR